MPFLGLFRPFFGYFWSKMARNKKFQIMVKLGFSDAANPMAQKFLPKNGVFCHFLAFLGHFLAFFGQKWPETKNSILWWNWGFSTLRIQWRKNSCQKNGIFRLFLWLGKNVQEQKPQNNGEISTWMMPNCEIIIE